MFINTKKTIKIKSDNDTAFEASAGWIGEIPKWVEEHWYFKALCRDGSVTAIVSSRDKDIARAIESVGTNTGGKTGKSAEASASKSGQSSKADGDTSAISANTK